MCQSLRKWFQVLLMVFWMIWFSMLFVCMWSCLHINLLAVSLHTLQYCSVVVTHRDIRSIVIAHEILSLELKNVCLLGQSRKLDMKLRLQEHWTRIIFSICSGKYGMECSLLMVAVKKYSVPFQRGSLDTKFWPQSEQLLCFYLSSFAHIFW